MLIDQQLEMNKLLLQLLKALSEGSLTAHWTNHAVMRANELERDMPKSTIMAANFRRPIVIDTTSNFEWYACYDKTGNPSIAVKDELYGAFWICYDFGRRNPNWVLKSCLHKAGFHQNLRKRDLTIFSDLADVVTIDPQEPEEALLSPEWELEEIQFPPTLELQDLEEGEDTTSPNQEARTFARFQLEHLDRSMILKVRKALGITGNGTGKRGAVSTELAIDSILDVMEERGDYAITFDV